MKTFEIEVWYRYVINGEQEKEHEFHTVEAVNLLDALLLVQELYKNKRAKPFSYYYNGKKQAL
jgi:hypothetical protein